MEMPGLQQILGELSTEQLLTRYWPDKFAVFHRPIECLGHFTSIPELFDPEALADRYEQSVSLWYPADKDSQFSKYLHKKDVAATDALAYYKRGATLYFTAILEEIREFREIARNIEIDLGLPPGSCRMELFASKAGSGTPPHFDHEVNLNIQLRGRKKWTVAPNILAPNPCHPYKPMEGPPQGFAKLYIPADLPNEIPTPHERFETAAGSIVFLPQGYWHSTVAQTDSIALSIVLVPPTWLDLALRAIKRRLIVDEKWRARAFPQFASRESHERLVAQLPLLVSTLEYDEVVRELLPVDNPSYEVKYGGMEQLRLEATGNSEIWRLHVKGDDGSCKTLVLPGSFARFVNWVIAQKTFDASTALANAGPGTESRIRGILDFLASAEVLKRIS